MEKLKFKLIAKCFQNTSNIDGSEDDFLLKEET